MSKMLNDVLVEAFKRHQELVGQRAKPEQLDEVIETYYGILNRAPDNPHVIFLLASALGYQGHSGAAIQLYRRVLAIDPQRVEAVNNIGTCYKQEHMNDEAKGWFRRAYRMNPKDSAYPNNIATLYINEGDPEPGEKWAREAIAIDPNNVQAQWNLGLTLLEQGRWKEGFHQYEYGLLSRDRLERHYGEGVPAWDGEPVDTLVVYGEQGIGDEIMFCSALQEAQDRCKTLIVDCHPRLESVVKRSFPGAIVYPTRKDNAIEWPLQYQIDAKCAAGSLFHLFRCDGFPKKPYLIPDDSRAAALRCEIEKLGPPPYIGLAWNGGSKRTHTHLRRLKLGWLRPIIGIGGTFVSLDYWPESVGKAQRAREDGINIHLFEEQVFAKNYDETIALIEALDLVIAPNTTIIHACGAIGKEAITLTPYGCAWRYRPGGDHMAMYGPWVHQCRQRKDEPWQEVIQRAASYAARILQEAG